MIASFAGLSLRDLEYAAAVGRTKHFGRAAQSRKLEALLGTDLFERGRKGVQITAPGAALLAQIDRVLAEAHGLLEIARGGAEPLSRSLRLGAIQTLGPYYLPFLLRHVRAAFPQLSLQLSESQTESLVDQLRSGAMDAILAADPVPGDGLTVVQLFFEPFMLVCPVGHRLAGLPLLHLPDLAAADLILLEEGHCLRDQALSLCDGAGSQMRQATSVETLWHMIAAGEGYSLLPALSLAGRQAMDGLVTSRALPEAEAGRVIALAWRDTDPRGPALRRFAETLRAALPDGVRPV